MTATSGEVELKLRIERIEEVADGVRLLRLADRPGVPLPAWEPGAHVDLALGDLVRQYSLCGEPADPTGWTVAVLREAESRGGSSYVHDKLAVGDTVTVRGPRNHFRLDPAPRYRFVAGGIGITPLLPMMAAATARGAEWTLDYGGRTRASMAFVDMLEATYGARVRVHPQDRVGLLPLADLLADPEPGTLVYCCGPAALLATVEELCTAWPVGALRVEHFSPKEVDTAADTSFEVELADSGRVVDVPADRSILASLREAGVDILSSCEEGTCGTCETGLVAGRVEHRDSLLTAAERRDSDVLYVCVSRAERGCPRLVLDL